MFVWSETFRWDKCAQCLAQFVWQENHVKTKVSELTLFFKLHFLKSICFYMRKHLLIIYHLNQWSCKLLGSETKSQQFLPIALPKLSALKPNHWEIFIHERCAMRQLCYRALCLQLNICSTEWPTIRSIINQRVTIDHMFTTFHKLQLCWGQVQLVSYTFSGTFIIIY